MRAFLFVLLMLVGCAVPLRTPGPEADLRPPSLSHLGAEVHADANAARRRASRRPLDWDRSLAAVAERHSRDMARRGYFDHVAPEGSDPQEPARRGGVACRRELGEGRARVGVSENLYVTTRYAQRWERRRGRSREVSYDWLTAPEIAEAAVRSWMESPGHRRNLLDPYARAHGIGLAVSRDHRVYVTQVLC